MDLPTRAPQVSAPQSLLELAERDVAPTARAAHAHLLAAAAVMNLVAEPRVNVIRAVKLTDGQGRYLFSWIVNRAHLLFYLRKPALAIMPSLGAQAVTRLAGVQTNKAGEVTVRIESPSDAEALTGWLFARETWTGPDAPRELSASEIARKVGAWPVSTASVKKRRVYPASSGSSPKRPRCMSPSSSSFCPSNPVS